MTEKPWDLTPDEFDRLFLLTAEEMAKVYDRCVLKFNAACDEIERRDTEIKVRQILGDVLGHRTYCVEVERG